MRTYKNVQEYIQKAPEHTKASLVFVRATILSFAPKSKEGISYGMPAYFFRDKPLIYFAAMKQHLGIYPTPGPIRVCRELLQEFSTSKGCIRIPYTKKISKKILKALLTARKKEITAMLSQE